MYQEEINNSYCGDDNYLHQIHTVNSFQDSQIQKDANDIKEQYYDRLQYHQVPPLETSELYDQQHNKVSWNYSPSLSIYSHLIQQNSSIAFNFKSSTVNILQSQSFSDGSLDYQCHKLGARSDDVGHTLKISSLPPTPLSDIMFPETSHIHPIPAPLPLDKQTSLSLDATDKLSDFSLACGRLDNETPTISLNQGSHYAKNWRKTKYFTEPVVTTPGSLFADSYSSFPSDAGYRLQKMAHNAIERRYRNKINERIQSLKNVVPALCKTKTFRDKNKLQCSISGYNEGKREYEDGVKIAKKLNKATILRKATEYIYYLKYSSKVVEQENQLLQNIIAQIPGGIDVLSCFQAQNQEFKKAKEKSLASARKEAQEREKEEHQNMLRERAAQRAELAELLPKRERKPYRRKNDFTNKNGSDGGRKCFLAVFLCLAIISPLDLSESDHHNQFTGYLLPITYCHWNSYLSFLVLLILFICIVTRSVFAKFLQPQ